jgi:hypothetical protein
LKLITWETTLTRITPFLFLYLLLGGLIVFLPACGGNEIKGQNPPETVLNPELTPTPQASQSTNLDISSPAAETTPQPKTNFDFDTKERPVSKSVVRSYKEKIARIKGPHSIQTVQVVTTPTPQIASAETNQPTPTVEPITSQSQTPMDASTSLKPQKSSHWFLWLVVLGLLGGGGYWYWSHRNENESPYQPQPPVGGLSPVSGFTAKRILREAKKPPFWNRSLF